MAVVLNLHRLGMVVEFQVCQYDFLLWIQDVACLGWMGADILLSWHNRVELPECP